MLAAADFCVLGEDAFMRSGLAVEAARREHGCVQHGHQLTSLAPCVLGEDTLMTRKSAWQPSLATPSA